MRPRGIVNVYRRFLQAAPAPAAPKQSKHEGHHTLILIALIVVASVTLLAALLVKELYKKKNKNTQGPSKDLDSHESTQTTTDDVHSTIEDSNIMLRRKAFLQSFASNIQNKLLTLGPTGQEKDIKNSNNQQENHDKVPLESPPPNSHLLTTLQEGWPMFNMEELLRSSAQPLFGMGVFGSAYKVIYNGLPSIMIRHLQDVKIGYQEFKSRIGDLAKLKHDNVLPIVAYYFSETDKIVLYEYLNFGNLATHLHGKDKATLNWPKRRQIAMDVARGVAYIHGKGRNKGLLHGNIKPANVLLRENGRACLTDTGLAHLVRACPAALNVGYRAPEVAHMNRPLTHKSDVYSYGVLLLELLTGKDAVSPSSNQVLDLPRLIRSSIQEEWTAEIFDSTIPFLAHYEEEMVLMLKIAMECVQVASHDRPSMARVVGMFKTLGGFDNLSDSTSTDISTPHDHVEVV